MTLYDVHLSKSLYILVLVLLSLYVKTNYYRQFLLTENLTSSSRCDPSHQSHKVFTFTVSDASLKPIRFFVRHKYAAAHPTTNHPVHLTHNESRPTTNPISTPDTLQHCTEPSDSLPIQPCCSWHAQLDCHRRLWQGQSSQSRPLWLLWPRIRWSIVRSCDWRDCGRVVASSSLLYCTVCLGDHDE